MAASNTTVNFKFNLTDFNKIPWDIEAHDNWHIIDALMARFVAISNIKGVWENALVVVVGDRYIDVDLDLIFEVLVAHTTLSSGTFAANRTAQGTYWQNISIDVTSKGTYTQNTSYNPHVFVFNGYRYGVVQTSYTSDNTESTTALSYDADVTAGNIITLVDLTISVADSTTAAASSATAAAASATTAAAAAVTALAAKITISTSAPSGGSAGDIWYRVTV